MKQCTKCEETKPLYQFYTNSKCKGGYNTQCKQCVLNSKREFFQAYKPLIINRRRKLRQLKRVCKM